MTGTQTITVNIAVSGPQPTKVTATDEGPGSTITVITGLTMVTFYDARAVEIYRGAWHHPIDMARLLPAVADPRIAAAHTTWATRKPSDKITGAGPGVLIGATGTDDPHHHFDRNTRTLRLRIGHVTWIVTDQIAYHAMATAYGKAGRMAKIVFGPERG